MQKIIVSEFISLDGIFEDPGGAEGYKYGGWTNQYWNDEIAKFKSDELFSSDTYLMGRVTYEGFAKAWPSRTGEFADKLNNSPKYVVSTTLKKLDWSNSHLINKNIVEEITRLKINPDRISELQAVQNLYSH